MGKRKRQRRSFTPEFKAEAVKVVQQSEKSLGTVARELDLAETALRRWVAQAEIDAGRGRNGAVTTDERAELAQAHAAIAEYVEIFYNRQRRHSVLDYLSPVGFERQHEDKLAV